jgi:hypothetical protein
VTELELRGAVCAVHADADATFVCTRCGTFGCAACVFGAVPEREVCAACAAQGLGEPIPWERRQEIGTWRSYWSTVRLVIRRPTAFFRTPTTASGVFGAVTHGVASNVVGLLLSYLSAGLTMMLGGGAVALVMNDEQGSLLGTFLGIYGCVFVGMSPVALVVGPANAIFGLAVSAAGSHGTLALFKKTRGTFEDTLRVLSYANAPFIWSWVPVVGAFTYPWVIWVEVIALRETHRCGTDWAVAAAVGYRLVLLLLVVGMYAAVFAVLFLAPRGNMGTRY